MWGRGLRLICRLLEPKSLPPHSGLNSPEKSLVHDRGINLVSKICDLLAESMSLFLQHRPSRPEGD